MFATCALLLGLGITPQEPRQVVIELRLMTVSPATADKVRASIGGADGTASRPLDDAATAAVMRTVQADDTSHVLCTPRIQAAQGQSVMVAVGDDEQVVAGLDVQVKDGKPVCTPRREMAFVGFKFHSTPTIADDGKFVRLEIDSALSARSGKSRPFTYSVPAESAGDPPISVTQWVEDAGVETQRVKATVSMADASTVVLTNGQQMVETRSEQRVPVLSNLPTVGKLFRTTTTTQEPREVLLFVTTRIVK